MLIAKYLSYLCRLWPLGCHVTSDLWTMSHGTAALVRASNDSSVLENYALSLKKDVLHADSHNIVVWILRNNGPHLDFDLATSRDQKSILCSTHEIWLTVLPLKLNSEITLLSLTKLTLSLINVLYPWKIAFFVYSALRWFKYRLLSQSLVIHASYRTSNSTFLCSAYFIRQFQRISVLN